jgi:hypothetical protein
MHDSAVAHSSRVVSKFLAKQEISVLPTHPTPLLPTDIFVSKIKNCDEKKEIPGCFMDPNDCDESTDGCMGRNVFSGIRFFVWAM